MLRVRLNRSTTVIRLLISFILFLGFRFVVQAESVKDSVSHDPAEIKRDREGCLKILKTELIPRVEKGAQSGGKKVANGINKSIDAVNAKLLKHKKECEIILREKY